MPKKPQLPPCAANMKCLCALHARIGVEYAAIKCDAREIAVNHPRQAIRVTFVNPTDRNLNPRWRAKCAAGSLVRYQDDDVDHVENAHRAAITLCAKLGWDPCKLVAGGLDNDGYVYVLAE